MSKNKDQIFADRFVAGDEAVFSEIYDEYWAAMFKYVIRILPDEEDVADVIQETFITFWELRTSIHIRSIKGYLFVLARNLAFKRFKESIRKSEVEHRLVEFYAGEDLCNEQNFELKELADLLNAEIDKLPSKMKEVFVLSRKHHLSYKEIAERLNISDQTVKKQIYNSLKSLRTKMDDEYIPYLCVLLLLDQLL